MPYFLVTVEYERERVVSRGQATTIVSNHVVRARDRAEAVRITETHGIAYPRWSTGVERRFAQAVLPQGPEVQCRRRDARYGYTWYVDGNGNLKREGVDPW